MKIVFVIAACLAASLVCLDAQQQPGGRGGGGEGGHGGGREGKHGGGRKGGHGGGREGGHDGGGNGKGGGKFRGQRSDFTGDVYRWNRTDGEDEPFTEIGLIKTNSTVVFVISLGNQNYLKAKSIYDFRDETNARVVYVLSDGSTYNSCFLSATNRTFDELKEKLKIRNNTEIKTSDDDKVSFTARGPPLSEEEVNALEDNVLSRFCANLPIFRVVPPGNIDEGLFPRVEYIRFFDLENRVTIAFHFPDMEEGLPEGERK